MFTDNGSVIQACVVEVIFSLISTVLIYGINGDWDDLQVKGHSIFEYRCNAVVVSSLTNVCKAYVFIYKDGRANGKKDLFHQ